MDVSKYKSLPNELRRYRKALGLSQREVARRLGLKDPTWISHWEHGDALPNLINAIRLSMVFQQNINDLFPDIEEAWFRSVAEQDPDFRGSLREGEVYCKGDTWKR